MQPAKRQCVETSFDFYPYLFLSLNCSNVLVNALTIVSPLLFVRTLMHRFTLELLDWFEKQLQKPIPYSPIPKYYLGRYWFALQTHYSYHMNVYRFKIAIVYFTGKWTFQHTVQFARDSDIQFYFAIEKACAELCEAVLKVH